MKKLILTIFTIINIFNYAQEVIPNAHIGVSVDTEKGHEFYTREEFPFLPAYYADSEPDPDPEPDPASDPTFPDEGYSFLWYTDEGHISNAEKPIFFFATPGVHKISLVLTPRKKGEDLKIFISYEYYVFPNQTRVRGHGDLTDVDMYADGELRVGDNVYIVVPINSCYTRNVAHTYEVGYNDNKLKFVSILPLSNLVFNEIILDDDTAFDIDLNKKIKFIYNWDTYREDVAVVLEFKVQPNAAKEAIGLKFTNPSKPKGMQCSDDIELKLSTISGPYDPNYKASDISEVNVFENPDKKVNASEVIYKIHFQNIGDAPVDSITIYDTLPDHLTFISFEGSSEPDLLVNATHTGGVLEWIISPNADVKGTNEFPSQPESSTKGWVSFKAEISEEQNIIYNICHCLTNIATIYFNDLAPIVTEANIIVIGDSLCFGHVPGNLPGLTYAQILCGPDASGPSSPTAKSASLNTEESMDQEWKESHFIAYPNPFNESFQLQGDLERIQEIEVLNVIGQKILSLSKYQTSIDINTQPSGLYLVRITTEEKQHIIRIEKH